MSLYRDLRVLEELEKYVNHANGEVTTNKSFMGNTHFSGNSSVDSMLFHCFSFRPFFVSPLCFQGLLLYFEQISALAFIG